MYVCVIYAFMLFCVVRGFAIGRSSDQRIQPSMYQQDSDAVKKKGLDHIGLQCHTRRKIMQMMKFFYYKTSFVLLFPLVS
jgi:hypothetical protein